MKRKNPHDSSTTTGKPLTLSRSYKKVGAKTVGSARVNVVKTGDWDPSYVDPRKRIPKGHRKPKAKPTR